MPQENTKDSVQQAKELIKTLQKYVDEKETIKMPDISPEEDLDLLEIYMHEFINRPRPRSVKYILRDLKNGINIDNQSNYAIFPFFNLWKVYRQYPEKAPIEFKSEYLEMKPDTRLINPLYPDTIIWH